MVLRDVGVGVGGKVLIISLEGEREHVGSVIWRLSYDPSKVDDIYHLCYRYFHKNPIMMKNAITTIQYFFRSVLHPTPSSGRYEDPVPLTCKGTFSSI